MTENLESLVLELCKSEDELPWIEFKYNNYDPYMIGQDISALANSAALHERNHAYMLWGVNNESHEIVGTSYNLQNLKKGNQELENWLRSLLSGNVEFEFHTVQVQGKNIGVLIVCMAMHHTVMFEKCDYIRIGSYTKRLSEYPTVQAQVWDRIRNVKFEEQAALRDLDINHALQLLNYTSYFDITGKPVPTNIDGICHYMLEENVFVRQDNGLYSITNMGALLLAKRLADFPKLARKAIRIVQYDGNNKLQMLKEMTAHGGYAVEFDNIINHVDVLIQTKEVINGAFREKQSAYPLLAIREIIANALIHQDFSVSGVGPVIEIFQNKIEITNPGEPLVKISRIIDNPPKSRNEKLAAFMRRLRMCEELGTGWDKIVISCEINQLPAPKIDLYEGSTRVTIFSSKCFYDLSSEDKLRACYFHACIRHIQGDYLTNSSLRNRFGLKDSASGSISRLIKDAVKNNYIKPFDPDTAPRYMKYIPVWA